MQPESIDQLAIDYWEWKLSVEPTSALLHGDHRYDDQMEDVTWAGEDAAIEALEGFVERAEAIDEEALAPDARITRAMLIDEASTHADELRSRMAEFAVDPSSGLHVIMLQTPAQFPLTETAHAEALVEKYRKLGKTFEDAAKRLRQGLAQDRTPIASAVTKVIEQIDGYLGSPAADDPYLAVSAPPDMDETAENEWRNRLAEVIESHIRPGYAFYRTVVAEEVAPKARPDENAGVCWLPDGEDVYDRAIRRNTSLDLAAMDVHNDGIEAVEALADEYRALGNKVLSTIDLDEIFGRLREDETLRFSTRAEILDAAQQAMDRADAAVGDWFGRLPQTECVMREVPEHGAAEAPLGYYWPPAPDGSRPGSYFVNTTQPGTRTRFESEALAFHESIPGHHFQLALAQELEDIPEFRKHALATAYVEGWGLYTERLADEMGLYSSDVTRMGMLSFDSWRACRLVVDTGIHALGWSRNDAIHYMLMNSPQARNNIEAEVDRYIGWPGQALAYMIGRNEIIRLRREAEHRMGAAFDIRRFHDVVLTSGPVTLPILGDLVDTYTKG